MMWLLCPECCQWREPVEGRCVVCSGTLDLSIPDPSLETIAEEVGDLAEMLGDADVDRGAVPKAGRLWATSNGLLFVPNESRVIVFEDEPRDVPAQPRGIRRFVRDVWRRLRRHVPVARFACERRATELTAHDRLALAELLRGDPGVLFWSRGAIASWRRERGQWEFLRPNTSSWPERISMRDRDGDRALQTWLETTACPLPVNVR